MTTNHGDTERAAREAIDRAIKRLQALPDYAGRPAWDKIVAEEMQRAFDAALRPASPGEVTVTEAMVEAGVRAGTEIWQAFPDLTADTVDECRQAAMRAALTAALSARPTAPDAVAAEWQATHRHVKSGGTYQVIGEAEGQVSRGDYRKGQHGADDIVARLAADGDKIVVYQAHDGKFWWRFADEFQDGRFEALRPTTQTTETEA